MGLELYAAITGNCSIVAMSPYIKRDAVPDEEYRDVWRREWIGPVNTKSAKTRFENDKRMVDNYVRCIPGSFGRPNRQITKLIMPQHCGGPRHLMHLVSIYFPRAMASP